VIFGLWSPSCREKCGVSGVCRHCGRGAHLQGTGARLLHMPRLRQQGMARSCVLDHISLTGLARPSQNHLDFIAEKIGSYRPRGMPHLRPKGTPPHPAVAIALWQTTKTRRVRTTKIVRTNLWRIIGYPAWLRNESRGDR
jgi:hypothetical protein